MLKKNFIQQENDCNRIFNDSGTIFHICSPENYRLLFKDYSGYSQAMDLMSLCFAKSSSLELLAFQIMSNHFHFVVQGDRKDIQDCLNLFGKLLSRWGSRQVDNPGAPDFKLFIVNDLNYLRNVLAYVNRNGYLVCPDKTPFTYPWGANLFYFNDDYKRMAIEASKPSSERWRRQVSQSHIFDKTETVSLIDNHALPLSFCNVALAESFYRDARHYYQCISKNVESFAEISKTIGESIIYTDGEIYSAAISLARKKYDFERLPDLPSSAKIEIARKLHYDYNAGDKQILRILRMDLDILSALW